MFDALGRGPLSQRQAVYWRQKQRQTRILRFRPSWKWEPQLGPWSLMTRVCQWRAQMTAFGQKRTLILFECQAEFV